MPLPAVTRALALSCHPIPSVAVTALLAGMVALADVSAGHALLATGSILAGQLSIGWSNDAIDAERDRAVARPDKPVALGAVSPAATMRAAALAVGVAAALAVPLGGRAWGVVMLGIAAGWAYNVRLKASWWSWAPFALAFGTLPAVATLSASPSRWPAAWAIGAGALLGTAAHVANVLPDLLADARTGVRGMPHRLGARASAVLGPMLLVAASVLILLVPPDRGTWLPVAGLVLTVALAAWAGATALKDPGSRRYFFAVIAIAALDLSFFALSGSDLS